MDNTPIDRNARWVFYLDEHDRWHWQARDTEDKVLRRDSNAGFKHKNLVVLDAIKNGYEPGPESVPAIKWVFYRDAADEWRWRAKALNGAIIGASSEGYNRHSDAVINAMVFGFRGYLSQSDELS